MGSLSNYKGVLQSSSSDDDDDDYRDDERLQLLTSDKCFVFSGQFTLDELHKLRFSVSEFPSPSASVGGATSDHSALVPFPDFPFGPTDPRCPSCPPFLFAAMRQNRFLTRLARAFCGPCRPNGTFYTGRAP